MNKKLLTFSVLAAAVMQGCNMSSPVEPLSAVSGEQEKSAQVVCGGYDVSEPFLTTYKEHSDDLGCSRSAKTITPNGLGYYQRFEYGNIMKKNTSAAAFEVHGLIFAKYGSLGWENGYLKFPNSNEKNCPYNKGRFSLFEGGRVYWQNNAAEAYVVRSQVGGMYNKVGITYGPLGFPISDTKVVSPNKYDSTYYNNFQNGIIKHQIKRNSSMAITFNKLWVVMENPIYLYSVDPLVTTRLSYFGIGKPANGWGNERVINVNGSGFTPNASFSVYVDQPTKGPIEIEDGYVGSDGRINFTSPFNIDCIDLNKIEVPSGNLSTIRVVDAGGKMALATYSTLKCQYQY